MTVSDGTATTGRADRCSAPWVFHIFVCVSDAKSASTVGDFHGKMLGARTPFSMWVSTSVCVCVFYTADEHHYAHTPVHPLACVGLLWTLESSCRCWLCESCPPAGLFCWGRGWLTRWGRACCWRWSRRYSCSPPNGLSGGLPLGPEHRNTVIPLF